jgi:hypothetical protein
VDPGAILSEGWALYRAHFGHLVTIAAVVYVPLGALSALLSLAGLAGIAVGDVLNLAAIFLVQGALVKAVEDVRDGRADMSVAETFGHAGGRLVTLAAAGILAAIGIAIGLVLLIVPGLILLTWWLVLSPVVMLESRGVLDSFGRSRALVRGYGWPVFGVAVLTILVLLAFNIALGIVTLPLGDAARGFLVPAIASSLAAPFAAVAWTLTYFRLREHEEAAPAGPAAPERL